MVHCRGSNSISLAHKKCALAPDHSAIITLFLITYAPFLTQIDLEITYIMFQHANQ